jgi:hypothetical protein
MFSCQLPDVRFCCRVILGGMTRPLVDKFGLWRAFERALRGYLLTGSTTAAQPGLVDRKMVVPGRVRVDSVPQAVTPREEVRPMNAVPTWVLPLVVTVGRLT